MRTNQIRIQFFLLPFVLIRAHLWIDLFVFLLRVSVSLRFKCLRFMYAVQIADFARQNARNCIDNPENSGNLVIVLSDRSPVNGFAESRR